MIDNKLLSKLTQNLLEILNDDEYYDITVEVGNDPDIKIFRAHMVILNYRSPYLRRILSTNKKKNEGTLTNIKLPSILPDTFRIILRYIYGGSLFLEEYDISDIIKILIAANELGLQELIPYLESFLIENKKHCMKQNFDLIYQTTYENDSFLELQKYCTDLISKESNKIFNSPRFTSVPEKLLVTIIKNDNHQMNEIQVWEHVIKWGLAQNPELPSDPTSFSKDDFNTLKNTLQQCIPFIKFRNLTSKEFLKKVKPYKKILPKELYNDLLEYFLDSDNEPIKKSEPHIVKEIQSKNIDSKIITNQQAELISKWIDKLETTDKSYEFKLLYRDSHNEFGVFGSLFRYKKCQNACKNQFRTVTIYKVRDSNEILGGYNPIEWKFDGSYGITNDSFIFSFKNSDIILSRIRNEKDAICNGFTEGPSFDL
ncbi:hypothetical protein RirG_220260 [Rhizophagus irregularis DAOM 197198w]|uniref:Kelch-like protein 17 n=1 Tax=Rhizophagus irregularis (strain DAOM 197198w) TaxID=1432141 RepID=A0A015IP30_RHIIW|nr:hypothetical protein RirG_220260 [Rhizophagus irregularis DAOM 197198w]